MANPPLPGTSPARLTLAADRAGDLMAPNPVSIEADAPVAEAIALLTDRGLSAAPVIDEAGHPRGVISRDDILVHERERLATRAPGAAPAAPDPTRVADIMTPTVFSVPPDTPARAVVGQLLGLRVQQLFVVDGDGALIGSINTFDVLRHLV
jgi:CBS domain-containing protein